MLHAVVKLDVRLPGNKRVLLDFLRTEMCAVIPRQIKNRKVYKLTTGAEVTETMCDRIDWRIFQNTDGWRISWVSLVCSACRKADDTSALSRVKP